MPQLHLRLSEDLEKALRVFADAHEITISAAIRVLLTQALASQPAGQPEEIQR